MRGGRWAARHVVLLEWFRVQSNSLAFPWEEFRSRGRKEYVPLRSNQVDIRHCDRVNQIAVYYQSNLHRVASEGDHVWKGTDCRKEQRPCHIGIRYLNNERLYRCVRMYVCVQMMTEYFIYKYITQNLSQIVAPTAIGTEFQLKSNSVGAAFSSISF